MSKVINAIVIGFFLFAASAGGSWFYVHYTAEPVPEVEEVPEEIGPDLTLVDAEKSKDVMPVAVRPDSPISIETATALAQSMMAKETAMAEAEKRLQKEERRIKMLFEDMKREQERLMTIQSKVEAKIIEAKEAVKLLQLEKDAVDGKLGQLQTLEKRLGKKAGSIEDEELDRRVAQIKEWFETVDAKTGAAYLMDYAAKGNIDFVAKLLDELDKRSAARLLENMNDRTLVSEILDQYKGGGTTKLR